ncbi:TetR/AcrR family transcriptional regulator [Nocardiopsis baichengensis]|uniref:TetR/AcrR family transcriptional regulator n=1 Tax=Nocardiopsis baichengensis TaxID=280240 RepID=UPI0003477C56|nr:hypothetical protein [Nocardiopsis baichengensis]
MVPRIADLGPGPADPGTRAGMFASRLLGAALCRYVLRLPPLDTMDTEEVVAWIGPALRRYPVE